MSIKIALVGNPNSGKSTLFNALTGSNQHIGNWPGVTVEKKSGHLKNFNVGVGVGAPAAPATAPADVEVIDLPGIYSLTPHSPEEAVAKDFLTDASTRPDAILNIVDGTHLERNLFLTTQLLELGIPVVLAVNMMDIVRKRGEVIDDVKLSEELCCKVAEISALTGDGVYDAARLAVEAANGAWSFGQEQEQEQEPLGQQEQSERYQRYGSHKQQAGTGRPHCSHGCLNDEERYAFISGVMKDCTTFKANDDHLALTDRIDRVVTDRYLALPIFAAVMFAVYFAAMTVVGSAAAEWANEGLFGEGWQMFGVWIPGVPVMLGGFLESMNCASWVHGLVIDGALAGVGSVLGFVPQLFILFIFLAILESCGYMARVAFIMDRFFRRIGLSGRSFIPFIIGTGCSVPAIMAARTIEDGRARRMTVVVASFVPCSAKLPVIAMIGASVFGGTWWVAPSAYFVGVAAIVCSCLIMQRSKLLPRGASPFVMELPAYKLPRVKSVLKNAWERGWSFVKKAGTVILAASVAIWFASNFGWGESGFGMTEMPDSILAKVGGIVAWIFAPLGWGNWQAATAAFTGLIAKENIVSTLGVLYGGGAAEQTAGTADATAASFTALSAYSFLLFNLLCVPCAAAVGAIRREMGSRKWFLFAIAYQCAFAYIVSLCVYQLGRLFGG